MAKVFMLLFMFCTAIYVMYADGLCLTDLLVVSTSCSLMHTAVDLINETKLDSEIKLWLAFAAQKVVEVNVLAKSLAGGMDEGDMLITNVIK